MLTEPLSESAQRVWRYICERQWRPQLELDSEGRPCASLPEVGRRRGVSSQRRLPSWPRSDHSRAGPSASSFFRTGWARGCGDPAGRPARFAPQQGEPAAGNRGAPAGRRAGTAVPRGRVGPSQCDTEPQHSTQTGPVWRLGPRHCTSTPAGAAPPSLADEIISASQSQLRRFQRRRPGAVHRGSPPPARADGAETPTNDNARNRCSRGNTPSHAGSVQAAATHAPSATAKNRSPSAAAATSCPTQPARGRAATASTPAPPTARRQPSPRERPRFSLLSPFGLLESPPLAVGGEGASPRAPAGARLQVELSEEVPGPADGVDPAGRGSGVAEQAGGNWERAEEAAVTNSPRSDEAGASDSASTGGGSSSAAGATDAELPPTQSTLSAEIDRLIDSAVPSPPRRRPAQSPGSEQTASGPPQRAAELAAAAGKQTATEERSEKVSLPHSPKNREVEMNLATRPETDKTVKQQRDSAPVFTGSPEEAGGEMCASPTAEEAVSRKAAGSNVQVNTRRPFVPIRRPPDEGETVAKKTPRSPPESSEKAPKRPAIDSGQQADKDDAQLMRPPLHPVFRARRVKRTVHLGQPRTAGDGQSQADQPAVSVPADQCLPSLRSAAVVSLTAEHAASVLAALQEPAVACVSLCVEREDGGSQLRPAAARSPAAALVAAVTGGPLDGCTLRLRPDRLPAPAVTALSAALLAGPGRRVCCGARELLLFALRRCGLSAVDGLRCWRPRDLAIADWLLRPDGPARGLPALLTRLGGPLAAGAARDAALSRQQQLAVDLSQLPAADTELSRRLRAAQLLTLFERVETPLAAVLAAMEARGVRVDTTQLHEAGAACQRRLRALEAAAHRAAGTVFSLTSSVQLRRLLYDQLRLDARAGVAVPLTEHGLKSTNEQALQLLADAHPLPGLLLQHRRVTKLKSTYVDGVLGQVRGGAVFPHWLQTAAATGRVQAAAPNLQSVPKRPLSLLDPIDAAGEQKTILARAPYVARTGHTLLSVDFRQMELRLLAHLSEDAHLTAAIRDAPGGDIFRQLAALWTGRPAAQVDDAQREKTKRLVYGAVYGAGRERLAAVLECPPQQAQEALEGFLAACPAIGAFSRRTVAECRRAGFLTSLLGRRRWVPDIAAPQQQARSQAERQAVNFVIQGSASDLCKLVMLAVTEAAPDVPLLAQLHDELLWEVPERRLSEFRSLVERQVGSLDALLAAAGRPGPLLVPLPVAVASGSCWAALQLLETER